jgi:CheY-like chemotaxis protein
VDGITLERFEPGSIYDVGHTIGNLLLAEGWAVPYDGSQPALVIPLPDESTQPSVLVVDDDQETRTMLKTLLTDGGYVVHVARDGEQGLAQLRKHSPRVVLLDLKMPMSDGAAFIAGKRLLPKRLFDIPVLIVSGVDGVDREAHRLGAAWIAKPIDAAVLLNKIAALVHSTTPIRLHASESGA